MSKQDVKINLLTLNKFLGLQNANKIFRVPFYQRPFSWDAEQINSLIETIIEPDCHFLGNFILHEHEEENSVVFDIVDGQQRLTCFLLILKFTKEYGQTDWLESLTYQKGHERDKSILRLQKAKEIIEKRKDKILEEKVRWEEMYVQQTIVRDLDLAFTFFDAQNTAGLRALSKDILKARHLQKITEHELSGKDEWVLIKMDQIWSELESYTDEEGKSLTEYIIACLLAIRRWTRGKKSPHYFGEQTDYKNRQMIEAEFGNKRMLVKTPGSTHYPLSHKRCFSSYQQHKFWIQIPQNKFGWLGHITMQLEPGELFFQYVYHYHKRWKKMSRYGLSQRLNQEKPRVIYHISIQRLNWVAITIAVYLDDLYGEGTAEFKHLMEVVHSYLVLYRIQMPQVRINNIESLDQAKTSGALRYLGEMLRDLSLGIDPYEFEIAEISNQNTKGDTNGFDIKQATKEAYLYK